MTSRTDNRGVSRGDNFSPGGTLTRMENNTAAILQEIDNDRRSTLRNERYGTTSTYMSEHQSGTVYIRVSVAELKIQKCLQFELDETVWEAKQRILTFFSKDLKDPLNYGLYLPPMNGRAGKFLEEERMLREYPLHGPIGFLEFKYKRRVYKMIHLNARKLKQLHTKANFRQLLDAVKAGQLTKIHKMTIKGLDPNFHETSSGDTPLTYAVGLQKDKCREVIISLVSGGAHLDFRTKQGLTPMHKAVLNGNNLAVKTLLDLGASTDYKDSRGLSPLYYSVLYGKNPSCAEQLLHERATIGVRDEQGWFEIHQACKLGLVQHLEHLLFYGADLNVQNASGNTALHICAVNNNEQCTRVLLFRGANKHLYNYNNQTPQQVAIIAGNVALAELIKNQEDKDIVPFREIPKFSTRRPRISSSSMSLMSRSRSDPKLNISSAIEDANMPSMPGSMRSLPQNYPLYSDSGSYTASRGSDSPRSMSISSNSSGPGVRLDDIVSHADMSQRRLSLPVNDNSSRSPQHPGYHGNRQYFFKDSDMQRELHDRMSLGTMFKYCHPHSCDDEVIEEETDFNMFENSPCEHAIPRMLECSYTENGTLKSKSGLVTGSSGSFYDSERGNKARNRSNLIRTWSQYDHEWPGAGAIIHESHRSNSVSPRRRPLTRALSDASHGTLSQRGTNFKPEVWFPAQLVEESLMLRMPDKDQQDTTEFSGQYLEPILTDKTFVCVQPYAPTHPAGLWMNIGDEVKVNSVSDTGYWEGSIQDREGWFPAHYVQEFRLKNRAGSLDDLLSETRESTLQNRNTLAALVHADISDYAPRTVVLQRAPEGYGFVLRGAKSQLKPSGELDFRPTSEFPALQYLDSVDPTSVADQAGLKAGDFILEINGENVVRASHDRVVHLIRGTGDTLAMKVVTVRQGNRNPDWFVNQEHSLTMPNRKKKAPLPPQRDPRTSLSMSKSEGHSMSEELAAMETLDKAIAERRASEEKTASIRSRTAAKRVSCVELEGAGGNKLERASSTPNLLDKATKDMIYATPTVPTNKGTPSAPSSPTGVTMRPKGPPPPPPEQGSPRKQAPAPPVHVKAEINSTQSEVVVISTKKQSPYATPVVQLRNEEMSQKRSSFRPDEVDNASAVVNMEQQHSPSLAKLATDSGASSPRDGAEKQNVSFAEDKVYDHAASFLKKHPNARLLITADGAERARNRNSRKFEPEPDYEMDSGEDSPTKLQSPKPAVTVIAVGEKKQAPKPQHYTVHSTIPKENASQNLIIPPRPAGPAPTPPTQKKTPPTQKAYAARAPSPELAPPLPKSPPPDFDDELIPPSYAPESKVPPPAPVSNVPAAPPPPPPPPPPADFILKTNSEKDALGDIFPPVAPDLIAAAALKRQERIAKEGMNTIPMQNKALPNPKNNNQAAILAAVAKRREHLETVGQQSVVDSIESRLQKTKKLQAAKFNIAGSKTGKSVTPAGKPIGSVQTNQVRKETDKTVALAKTGEEPAREVNNITAKPLSFTVKTSKSSVKAPSKPTNETSNSAKVKRQESLKLKPEPLAKASVSQKTTDQNNIAKSPVQKEIKKEEKTDINSNDFLARAEKRRQEYLQRKQKSPPESKSSTPGTSTTGTPEKDRFRSTKMIEINSAGKKGTSPPVSAKPKTNGVGKPYTELQSPHGLVKVKPLSGVNGSPGLKENNLGGVPPPPPDFRDDRQVENTVVQLEIIPPPPDFSSDSGTDMNMHHSPGFSPDTASVVSSLSTLSSLSGDHTDGRGNGFEDLIAPPPPGFDDGVDTFIPPPPEFDSGKKTITTFNNKPVEKWLCNDVLDWLDSLKLSQYKESFQTNCIDGKKLLGLTRNNYIELGVSQVGHRMNIERSIKKAALKQNTGSKDIIASEHL